MKLLSHTPFGNHQWLCLLFRPVGARLLPIREAASSKVAMCVRHICYLSWHKNDRGGLYICIGRDHDCRISQQVLDDRQTSCVNSKHREL